MKKIFMTNTLLLMLSCKLFAFDFSPIPKQLSAHYVAPSQNLDLLLKKLERNGFTVLANTNILKKNNIITITNQELKNTNSYMATLQINVNPKEIRVQNPSYLAAAYLGKAYHYGQFACTVNRLENVLGSLNNSFEQVEFSTLAHYHFMQGLPKREDTITISKGSDLMSKVSTNKAKKYIAYTLELPNGSLLVGHKLRNKTHELLEKIGEEKNSQILPYEVIIRNNEVSMMDPKYYLTLSLPQLSLQQFVLIASLPDAIERNIKKAYQ